MNKKELKQELAKRTGIAQAKALEVLNELFGAEEGQGIIAGEVEAGAKVTIPGFGTFYKKTRAERTGTNPATKAKITIAAKDYVVFKPGKTLRDRIRG
jgi:DNA-binding protein HU-beta